MNTKTYNQLVKKIENIEIILNGGPGSGNFGHAGRPGKKGGSAPKGVLSSATKTNISKAARESLKEAQKHEPQVTNDLANVLSKNNARFKGLAFRLKGNASLERKILADADKLKCSHSAKVIQSAARNIHDNLRYTAIISSHDFGDNYNRIKSDLESKGYQFVKVKNTMGDTSGGYRGVNTQIKNPSGYTFELQFHTNKTFNTKMAQHANYEIARDSKKYSAKERENAEKRMAVAYKSIKTPEGVGSIKSFDISEKEKK